MKPMICFDWDGTIADSMPLCIAEVRQALLAMGLPDLPDETLKKCNGPTYEETVPLLGIPPERAQEYYAERLKAELSLVSTVSRLYPGMRELLEELKPLADLYVVSNGLPEYLSASVSAFGLEAVFCQVRGWREGRSKAENLAQLLAEARPERAIMVGDRLGDIAAGQANGLPTIAAGFGYGSDEEYSRATHWARNMAQLRALLLDFSK